MIDDVASTVIRDDADTIYALQKVKKTIPFWKRKKQPRVVYQTVLPKENYLWKQNSDYLLFCILVGLDIINLDRACLFSFELKGGMFLLLTFLSMMILVLPMMYVEVFLGTYTRLPNSQQYRMAPIFFGFCILVSIATSLVFIEKSNMTSIPLNFAMALMLKTNYLNNCPKEECYDVKRDGPLNMNCTPGDLAMLCDGKEVRYQSVYYYWKEFGKQDTNWSLLCCIFMTWLAVTVSSVLGIRFMGVMMKWMFSIHTIMQIIVICLVSASTGNADGVSSLFVFKLELYDPIFCLVTVASFTKNAGLIAPSGYMTYAVYKQPSRLSVVLECILIAVCKYLLNTIYLLEYHLAAAVLTSKMKLVTPLPLIMKGGAFVCTLVPEFLFYHECPILFIVVYLISTWMIEIAKLGIFFHMSVMNMFHYISRLMSYDRLFRISWAIIHCGLTALYCLAFRGQLMFLGREFTGILLNAACLTLEGIMLFYCYGIKRLRDDIQFYSNRRSMQFWSVLWYIYPVVAVNFLIILFVHAANYLSFVVTAVYFFICFGGSFIYIMINYKHFKRLSNLLKPQFFWGPPQKALRALRKKYSPNTMIRSEPRKKERVNFRLNSIKEKRENLLRRKKIPGLVFVDTYFFTNIGRRS